MARYELVISDLTGAEHRALAEVLSNLFGTAPARMPAEEMVVEALPTPAAAPVAPVVAPDNPLARITTAAENKVPARRGPGRPPKTLPANTGSPTSAPTPTVAHPSLVLPDPVVVTEPVAPAPRPLALVVDAPVAGEVTMETILAKARLLGNGPFKQGALIAVLHAMGAPSFPKVAKSDYPAFDALLDAATAFCAAPGASKEYLTQVCEHGHFDSATAALTQFTANAMGL